MADLLLLAAGYGKRLRPLTDVTPKPLIKVGGRSLIDWNLDLIREAGFKKIFVNSHHLAAQIASHLKNIEGLQVEVIFESVLLDTAGAVKNIESKLTEDCLVTFNSDILIGRDFSLSKLLATHMASQNSATLVLREDPDARSYGAIGVDFSGRVCTFLGETFLDCSGLRERMYVGISVLSRGFIERMRPGILSLTRDSLREALQNGDSIGSLDYSGYFCDVGTPERLQQASNDISRIFGISP